MSPADEVSRLALFMDELGTALQDPCLHSWLGPTILALGASSCAPIGRGRTGGDRRGLTVWVPVLALLLTTGDAGLNAAFPWPASLKDPALPLPMLRGLEGLLRPHLWWEAASLLGWPSLGNLQGSRLWMEPALTLRTRGACEGLRLLSMQSRQRRHGAHFLPQETGFQIHPV